MYIVMVLVVWPSTEKSPNKFSFSVGLSTRRRAVPLVIKASAQFLTGSLAATRAAGNRQHSVVTIDVKYNSMLPKTVPAEQVPFYLVFEFLHPELVESGDVD